MMKRMNIRHQNYDKGGIHCNSHSTCLYWMAISSTSKMSVAPPGITPENASKLSEISRISRCKSLGTWERW